MLGEKPKLTSPLKYVSGVFLRLGARIKSGFELTMTSTIPVGAGLASSAALLVGTIRCLTEAFQLRLQPADIAEMAYVVEHFDLMTDCGRMDPYAISYAGISYIETGIPPRVTHLHFGGEREGGQRDGDGDEPNVGIVDSFPLVVGDTCRNTNGNAQRCALASRLADKQSGLRETMKQTGEIVEEGRKAILQGDPSRVAALMNQSRALERRMGGASERVDLFCDAARDAGALGTKQTGSGGCIVAYCPGEQEAVAEALRGLGGKAYIFDLFSDPAGRDPADIGRTTDSSEESN